MGFISCAQKHLVSTFHPTNPAMQDSSLFSIRIANLFRNYLLFFQYYTLVYKICLMIYPDSPSVHPIEKCLKYNIPYNNYIDPTNLKPQSLLDLYGIFLWNTNYPGRLSLRQSTPQPTCGLGYSADP